MNSDDTDYYSRWDDDDCVKQFSDKFAGDFFKTETHFLDQIMGNVSSVLDIGCASGRLVELLRSHRPDITFTGVDISKVNIDLGKSLYPDLEFHHQDALTFQPQMTFDLVNATGVCQHEPRFENLISHMAGLSSRYVLFDVKLAEIEAHIVDIERANCGREDSPLYFILLSLPRLIANLQSIKGVKHIKIFGYTTPTNARTTVPSDIDKIASAGVLLEMGEPGATYAPTLHCELPDWLDA